MAPKTNKLAFGLCLVGMVSYWLLNLFDRVFLGKHAINQVLLGSELGIWCAFFSHFVLRDQIFAHIRRLIYEEPSLSRSQAVSYGIKGSAVVACAILITCAVGCLLRAQKLLKQEWLINLRDTCGEEFETD